MKKTKGFTLIELLVAATIISVLITAGIVSYTSVNKRSRDTKRRSDMEQMRSALEMYRADNTFYPNAGGGSWTDVSALSTALVTGGYMPVLPTDPKAFGYEFQATNLVSGQYYGYCLGGFLETDTPSSTCDVSALSPPTGTTAYGLKNP